MLKVPIQLVMYNNMCTVVENMYVLEVFSPQNEVVKKKGMSLLTNQFISSQKNVRKTDHRTSGTFDETFWIKITVVGQDGNVLISKITHGASFCALSAPNQVCTADCSLSDIPTENVNNEGNDSTVQVGAKLRWS
jgi:hypothetical protein